MTSLAKAKVVYGARMPRRKSAPSPPISTDRTGLKIQEIPPELCHLTGDALATPFPPIALGGYIRYYRAHPEHLETFGTDIWDQARAKLDLMAKESTQAAKKRRRASSASVLLGPLLSHLPKPSLSEDTPLKSHLFHNRTSSAPESTPSPISPGPPPIPPRSKRRPILSIIHEGSRETMRSDIGASISLPTTPLKTRVISYPSAISTHTKPSSSTSALTLSLAVSSPPERSSPLDALDRSNSVQTTGSSVSLSPGGSLRRKKRRILRTPSVENDFARSARELLGFGRKGVSAGKISRENSIGSEVTEEDTILSPTMSVSTALTSLLDTLSISSSPSSPTKFGGNNRPISGNKHDHPPDSTISTTPPRISLELGLTNSSPTLDHNFDSDASSSPTLSTPPTTFVSGGLLDDAELQRFVLLELDDDQSEDGNRDSWASFITAKSYIEPSLPIVLEADENSAEVGMRKTEAVMVAAQV